MRVLCRHGHFAFYPRRAGEVARFVNYFGQELVRENDYFTFPFLKGAPRHSLIGQPFLGLPATVTYEGRAPWDVMRKNNVVYNFQLNLVVPKLSIVLPIDPPQTGYFFLAQSSLIQPGSRNALGQQILSYDGEYLQDTFQFRVSEFGYE